VDGRVGKAAGAAIKIRRQRMRRLSRRALLRGASLCAGLGLIGSLARAGNASAYPDPEEAGFVGVRGGQVWYRINGARHAVEGKLPLLVIHGGPGFSHHYLLALTELANDRPVVFYDQLDSGNSERPGDPANWTVERFVSEVDDVRAALGFDRLIVLGSSWGGTVAAEYPITRPAGLVGLVLASPLISTPRWIADNTAYRKKLPADVQKVLDEHEAAGTTGSPEYQEAVMVFYRRHLCRVEPWPDEVNRAFELANFDLYVTMWGNTEFNATGTLKDYDASARLHRIQTPTLFTCGEFDEATPAACKEFAALVPNGQAEVIPDASHMAFVEQPEPYMAIVRAFFDTVT
jgi:proline-specific peptidase